MSGHLTNWKILSSLARQWTMEDEEEVEREKRRRVKSSSTADPDANSSPRNTSSSEIVQEVNSMEQMQVDFVEMLRLRDEKRRMRHVETLRRQKEEEEGDVHASRAGGHGDARVELLGDLNDREDSVFKAQPALNTTSASPAKSVTTSITSTISSSKPRPNATSRQHENGESSSKDPDPKPSSSPARKFVSSVSISLDSGRSSPKTPCSPMAPLSPQERWPSPCQSPFPQGAQSPVQNGHVQENRINGSPSNGNFEQTTKPAFIRQSSRTVSFRMMRKKEEEQSSPLQRSASVRMASKKFEGNTDQNDDESKESSFHRNSRTRISSRSIQEKMERLAQASQKSESVRQQDVTQRTLALMEEVSRKREIFEKEQPAQSPTSPGVSRQESRVFTSAVSDRINRWLNKTNKTGSSNTPSDLRHVDITSKRSLFENRGEEDVRKTSPGKIYK